MCISLNFTQISPRQLLEHLPCCGFQSGSSRKMGSPSQLGPTKWPWFNTLKATEHWELHSEDGQDNKPSGHKGRHSRTSARYRCNLRFSEFEYIYGHFIYWSLFLAVSFRWKTCRTRVYHIFEPQGPRQQYSGEILHSGRCGCKGSRPWRIHNGHYSGKLLSYIFLRR